MLRSEAVVSEMLNVIKVYNSNHDIGNESIVEEGTF